MNYLPRPPEFRSALTDAPGGTGLPSVGVVVPIYNEAAMLDSLVADLLAQDYPRLTEIWLVDGGSTDGTAERLRAVAQRDLRVWVLNNPGRVPAAALNLAIPKMRTDIVMRLDAHATYATDVVRESVDALLATGAAGVGAVQRPIEGKTLVARSIVAAQRSRFGLGGARFRQEGAAGWVESVWNGCYWHHVVQRVGPLREDLVRAEDNDFNERIRQLGYGLYLSPAIRASYQPRTTLRELWSQYFANGKGVALAVCENRRAFGLRHFAPPAFVASLIAGLLAGLLWPPAMVLFWALLGLYLAGLALATALGARSDRRCHLLLMPLSCATLHFAYGIGALWAFCTLSPLTRSRRASPSRAAANGIPTGANP